MNCVRYTTTIIPGDDEDSEMTEVHNIEDYEYMNWSSDDEYVDDCVSSDDMWEYDDCKE